ncbi:MAG: preprotein translocase subunit SecY [Spirochaetales bacterium]|nr:preprotein translocase subunit SecY [Spirochaetales bacterium]
MASNSLVDIFRIKDLRNRILFTIFALIIFRLGVFIPIPGIDRNAVIAYFNQGSGAGGIFDFIDFFVGGAFSNVSIFMQGIMPYITTSIIMNLLTIIFPKLKKISEEEGGKKKIQRYTRYLTIPVCILQTMASITLPLSIPNALTGMNELQFRLIAVLTVTTGTIFLVWLGEQITNRGVGNGISILIFAGIVARMPQAVVTLVEEIRNPNSNLNPVFLFVVMFIFVVVIALVIYEQQGQRKIPVHYAKRVVGRKVYGAQNTYLPFKINPSGVIPVIFASAVLTFPIQIAQSFKNIDWLQGMVSFLAWDKLPYNIIYALMIIFFSYFYTQVTLNPYEISKNIREHGGSIPGIRSEKMEGYLNRILQRIILPGSLFLAFIAIIPTVITLVFNFPHSVAMLLGGTSLLILVGVDLDTMSQIEGHLRMHHHDGLLKKGRIKSRNL